jgi:hypothetical protein
MPRAYYSSTITDFLGTSANEILGILVQGNGFALEQTQRDAWLEEFHILKTILQL